MTIRIFEAGTSTLADFNAAALLGFDFSVAPSVTATIDDDETLNADPASSVTIGDDNQGPITAVSFHRVVTGGETIEIAAVSRADVADFLLLRLDPVTGNVVTDTLPAGSYSYTEEFTPATAPSYTPDNEAPTALALTAAPLPEDAVGNDFVGTLVGTDPDDGDTLTYTLIDDAGGLFALDAADSTRLLVAPGSTFDFEAETSYGLTARVTDALGETFDQDLTVSIADVNEAPSAPVISAATVPENSVGGTLVGTVSSMDPDAGDTVTFTLDDDADGLFVLNGDRLEVAPGADLDFESGAFRTVTVVATDDDGLEAQSDVSVMLTNVNEAPFIPSLSGQFVVENSAAGTLVGRLFSSDPDAGDVVSFTLTDDADGRFALDGDRLIVADGADIDFDMATFYDVSVEVSDLGGLTSTRTFGIDVFEDDEMEGRPDTFTPIAIVLGNTNVDENAEAGTVVGALQVTDVDQFGGHRLSLLNDANGRFALDGNLVVVAPGATLDHEALSSHVIIVRAQDDDGNVINRSIEIDVNDLDEEGDAPAEPFVPPATVPQFVGTDGDDRIEVSGNRASVNGLEGRDTAVFDASINDYAFEQTLVGYRLLPNDSGGQINLASIESFEFNDASLELVSNEITGSVYRLYRTALDREVDPLGGAFWSSVLESGAATLDDVADAFTMAPEFFATYGEDLSNDAFVDNLYEVGLQREVDPTGDAFWTGLLDSGTIDRGAALVAFSESDEARALYAEDTDSGLLIFA